LISSYSKLNFQQSLGSLLQLAILQKATFAPENKLAPHDFL
jgi:hypothetical protein